MSQETGEVLFGVFGGDGDGVVAGSDVVIAPLEALVSFVEWQSSRGRRA